MPRFATTLRVDELGLLGFTEAVVLTIRAILYLIYQLVNSFIHL